jgi:Zn-dependent protease with chaperone function
MLLLLDIALLFYLSLVAPGTWLGMFRKKPNLGIRIWVATVLLTLLSLFSSIGLALYVALDTYDYLTRGSVGDSSIVTVIGVGVLPWVLVAGIGIWISLMTMKFEPLLIEARALSDKFMSIGRQSRRFQDIPVILVPLEPRLAFAKKLGGEKYIFITRGTMDALTEGQLDAVLWHEHTHLKKHHLEIKSLAQRLLVAAPWSWLATCFNHEINLLAELSADQEAKNRAGAKALSEAKDVLGSYC